VFVQWTLLLGKRGLSGPLHLHGPNVGVRQMPTDLSIRQVSIFYEATISNCVPEGTAAGNEAIQECSKGSYCCDTNRPETGCCETSKDFFTLPDGTVIASIGANGVERPPAAQRSQAPPATSKLGKTLKATVEFTAEVFLMLGGRQGGEFKVPFGLGCRN
jgi:hypothetical protein